MSGRSAETTKARTDRLMGMSRAELVLHAQDLAQENDALRAELAKAEAEPAEPEHSQGWANMGGAVAFSIIERQAEGWSDAGKMMEQWGRARFAPDPTSPPRPEPSPAS